MSSLSTNDYACPTCGGVLELRSTALCCIACQLSFPKTGELIDLRANKPEDHDYPLARQDMERVNAQFSTHSWKEILGNLLECSDDAPKLLDELVDEGRYAWRVFLSLRPGMTMLNASGNLGTTTANLAPYFERVITLNPSYQNAVFTLNRLSLGSSGERVSVLIVEDNERLPLANECIDIAIVDAALKGGSKGEGSESITLHLADTDRKRKWFGLGKRNRDCAQLAFLHELSRVTRQDGSIFIRCGNRLNYNRIDRIFSANPEQKPLRSLAGILSELLRRIRKGIHGSNLHTLYGYRKLLKRAGFHYIELITFHPDDNQSEVIRPDPANFPLYAPPSASGWKSRIKQSPWVAPSFGIIARKRRSETSRLEEAIAERIVQKLGKSLSQFQTQHYLASSKGKLIIKTVCDREFLYVRLPLNEQAHQAEQQNHKRLQWLQLHRAAMTKIFPNPIIEGCEEGQHFFAETAVHGTPILALVKARRSAGDSLKMGLNFLVDLNCGHLDTGSRLGKKDFERFVSTPLASLSIFISDIEMRHLEIFFQDRLLDRRLPRGLLHGDYSAQNILTRDGRVSGLLDWEESVTDGIPALDAVCLTLSCIRRLEGSVEASTSLVDFARRKAYLADYVDYIEAYYDQTDTDPECHEALVLVYWISAIYHRVGLGRSLANTSDEQFIRRVITQVLDVSNSNTSSTAFSS